jgi:hypothetical protein
MSITITTTDTTDALLALDVTCKCPSGRRVLPIRVARSTVPMFQNGAPPDRVVMTYRCGSCRDIVAIRIKDFRGVAGTA